MKTSGKRAVRYVLVFSAGAVVGGLAVDLLAARSMQVQVNNVRSRFYAEQSFLAARARCRADWFGVALHSWNASNSSSDSPWGALRVRPADRDLLFPIVGGALLNFGKDRGSRAASRFVAGLDRADFARALEKLGRPEAQAEWILAAKLQGNTVAQTRSIDVRGKQCEDAEYVRSIDDFVQSFGKEPPN